MAVLARKIILKDLLTKHTNSANSVYCGCLLYYNIIIGKRCKRFGYIPSMSKIREDLKHDYGFVEGKEDYNYTIHNGGAPECDSIKLIKTECFCDNESERLD